MATHRTGYRVLLDTNVLVAGVVWPRWPYAVLQHAVAGDFRPLLSPFILDEVQRHLARIAPGAASRFETFLELSNYELLADAPPETVAAHAHLVRDAKDIPVALAAIQGAVDCLVTHDRDLTESNILQQQVRVLLPAMFLRDYLGWTSEALETIRTRTWADLSESSSSPWDEPPRT